MSQSSDSELYERDSQSQFVSQEGDEDVLWAVEEITAEKGKRYKVRWAGVDPKTNKPWAQSWVLKSDCTDDLVREWKRRKVKLKNKTKVSKGSRLSHVSHGTSRISMNSPSTVTNRNTRDTSTTVTPPTRAKVNGKRTRSFVLSDEDHNEDADPPLAQPKKKRKIDMDSQAAKSRLTTRGRKQRKSSFLRESDDEHHNQPEVTTSQQRKCKVISVKMEEEGSYSDEGTARIPPASTGAPSPSTGRKMKLGRSSSTPTPSMTPKSNTAYVKSKSGKLSTPKKRPRYPYPESSEDASSSSESDKVEKVVPPHKSPMLPPPKSNGSLPTISSTTIQQLQAYHTPSPSDSHHDEDQIVQEMYDEYVDFEAAHQQTNSGSSISTPSLGVTNDSYRQGEVPETETQSSHNTQPQSQSRSQPLVSPSQQRQLTSSSQPQPISTPETGHSKPSKQVQHRVPLKPSRVPTLIAQPQTPPARSSIISRMRPRTPGSGSHISLFDNGVAFHEPELEVHMEVDEEQNEPDEAEQQNEQKVGSRESSRKTSRAEPRPGPLRPIPRLSPSVFTPHLPSVPSASSRPNGTDTVPVEYSDDAEVVEPVSSIEQFTSPEKGGRKRKNGQDKVDRKGKGKGKEPANGHIDAEGSVTDRDNSDGDELENVVQKRGQQLAARARAEKLKRQRELDGEPAEGKRKTLSELLSKNGERTGRAKRLRVNEKEEEKLRKMKQVPGPGWEKEKEKEEEISRLLGESEEDAEHARMDLREEEEESTQDLIIDMGASEMSIMEDLQMDQGQDVEPPAQSDCQVEPDPLSDPVVEKQKNDTRASSKSKSSSYSGHGHRIRSQDELVLPPTAPVPSSTPIESQEQDNKPDFVATLALLNEKSQENAQLTKDINALREALATASAPRPRDLELERELEAVRTRLEAVQASLAESEKRAADLVRGKESAEKDREFFREHYAKASGFVTSVREENAELQKEAQIARQQASIGVEAVKSTYAARVKALEDDAKTYKRLALFIMEKDIRTNDDIRRRAAEEPELRVRCEELAREKRELRNEVVDLQEEVEDKETQVRELEEELKGWKRQVTVLNADLSKVKSLQEGEDKVYQCGWRLDDHANVPCDQVFTTYEEFELHMFSERHLDAKRTGS